MLSGPALFCRSCKSEHFGIAFGELGHALLRKPPPILREPAIILAGTPHLEEAFRVGEEVIPLVRGYRGARALAAE